MRVLSFAANIEPLRQQQERNRGERFPATCTLYMHMWNLKKSTFDVVLNAKYANLFTVQYTDDGRVTSLLTSAIVYACCRQRQTIPFV